MSRRANRNNASIRTKFDPVLLARARQKMLTPRDITREEVERQQEKQEKKYKRNIARGRNGQSPAMYWKTSRLRRAAVKWYCGWFPFDVRRIIDRHGAQAQHDIETLRKLMPKPDWTNEENERAKRTIAKCIGYNAR